MASILTVLPPMRMLRLASLGTVSVVIMARDTARHPSGCSWRTREGICFVITPGSSGTPITPVEATSVELAGMFSDLDVAFVEVRDAAMPWGPVAQLALPEFTRMACATALFAR